MALNGERTKLKEADIKKVDFVPAGAQQHSRISLFKSGDENSLFNKIIKAIGSVFDISDSNDNETPETFIEEVVEHQKNKLVDEIMCEVWDYTYALNETIKSIVHSDVSNKIELVQGSLDQFSATVTNSMMTNIKGDVIIKSNNMVSAERMATLKNCMKILAQLISEAETSSAVNHVSPDDVINKSQEQTPQDVKVEEPNNKKPVKADSNERSGNNMAEINKSALPQDVQDYILSLETQVAKSAEKPVGEDIYKGLPEAIVTILKGQEIQLRTANEMIAKMNDDSIEKEFIAKAVIMTDKLGVDANKFGKVLKSIHAANPELATEVENVIKAANEAVAKGNLFTEVGKESNDMVPTGIAKADAWVQIETLATAQVTKGESKTQSEAIDAVLKTAEGRKLYEIYTGKIKG